MSSPSSDEEEPSSAAAYRPFTKPERIQQLNDIDRSITNLLKSAGQALETLAASNPSQTPAIRRAVFEHTSNTFLKTLQSVDVRLRRQIYGLEEANIIPAEKAKKVKEKEDTTNLRGMKEPPPEEAPPTGDTGLGKLDIGWLNSRSGRVGRDFEAELWEKARSFLEDIEKGASNGHTVKDEVKDEDVDMT